MQPACSGQTGHSKLCLVAKGSSPLPSWPGADRPPPSLPGLAGLLSPPTSSLEGPAKRGPQGFKPRAAVGPTWPGTCSREDQDRVQNCSGLSGGPLS